MIRDEQSATTIISSQPTANGYAPSDQVDAVYDLTSDANNLYIGYAPQGSSLSAPVWTIRRISLSGGSPSASQWTAKGVAVWANRATETYL